MHLGGNRRWVPLSLGQNHKTLNVFGMQPEYQQDVTKTGNGERGAGSGERGMEVWERVVSGNLQKNPKWRSKKRERERRIQRKEFDRALVEIRWGRNCKSDSHFTFTF